MLGLVELLAGEVAHAVKQAEKWCHYQCGMRVVSAELGV